MAKSITYWPAEVKQGLLLIDERESFMNKLNDLTGKVLLTVQEVGKSRNLEQNAGYWLWLNELEQKAFQLEELKGWTKDDFHEYFKYLFLKRTKTAFGKVCEYVLSSSGLLLGEFSEYMEKVRRHCLIEWGIELPELVKK